MKLKNLIVPALAILLTAAVLLLAGAVTNPIRVENIQKEHVHMMRTLLPGSENFVLEPYAGDDANVKTVHRAENGFVVETSVRGYAGEIVMMTGVSNEGRVTGMVVRDMEETPGLGANALTDHVFLAQLLNTGGNAVVDAGADAASFATGDAGAAPAGDELRVDAITGATVTSKAIVRSVNSAVAVVTGADSASSATTWGG